MRSKEFAAKLATWKNDSKNSMSSWRQYTFNQRQGEQLPPVVFYWSKWIFTFQVLDEIMLGHPLFVLHIWRMKVSVEHDDGERENEDRIRILQTFNHLWIAWAVTLRKRLKQTDRPLNIYAAIHVLSIVCPRYNAFAKAQRQVIGTNAVPMHTAVVEALILNCSF